MDAGTWSFQCRACEEIFQIELALGRPVLDAIIRADCPHCGAKPLDKWHQIIGFRLLEDASCG
jgi:hypothetical protein